MSTRFKVQIAHPDAEEIAAEAVRQAKKDIKECMDDGDPDSILTAVFWASKNAHDEAVSEACDKVQDKLCTEKYAEYDEPEDLEEQVKRALREHVSPLEVDRIVRKKLREWTSSPTFLKQWEAMREGMRGRDEIDEIDEVEIDEVLMHLQTGKARDATRKQLDYVASLREELGDPSKEVPDILPAASELIDDLLMRKAAAERAELEAERLEAERTSAKATPKRQRGMKRLFLILTAVFIIVLLTQFG